MKTHLKRPFRLSLSAVACAGALSACAPYLPYDDNTAYGGPVRAPIDSPTAHFDRLDTNRDGFLSRAEVEPLGIPAGTAAPVAESAADTFRRMDANADGFLSRAEAGATFSGIPGGSFDAFDTNRDGFVNMTEALPHLQYLQNRNTPALSFNALDSDRDGFLNRAEAAPLLASTRMDGGRHVAAPALSFDRFDVDRDGFLTRAEAAAIANPLTFDRYDVNRDGFLSRSETDVLLRNNSVGGTGGSYGGAGTVYGPR